MSERAHFSVEQRQSLLEKFQQSGMSVSEFARANGLTRVLLSVWIWRYLRKGVEVSAVPAEVVTEQPALRFKEINLGSLFPPSTWAAELLLPSGATLKLTSPALEQLLPHLQNHFGPPCSA